MEKRVPAELLDVSAISHALTDSYWRVSVLPEVTSTQDVLRTSNPSHGDVLVTEFQSAGRGRLDRSFVAATSTALLFSFYIEPKVNRESWSFIPLLVGINLTQLLNQKFSSNNYSTKWPNDILHNELKVSGTIAEIHGSGVVIGVGVNTTMTSEQLPVPTATSLLIAEGASPNRNELLTEFLTGFAGLYARWENGEDLLQEYTSTSSTISRLVEAHQPDGSQIQGTAIRIDSRGALHLDSGAVIDIGDVVHLR